MVLIVLSFSLNSILLLIYFIYNIEYLYIKTYNYFLVNYYKFQLLNNIHNDHLNYLLLSYIPQYILFSIKSLYDNECK